MEEYATRQSTLPREDELLAFIADLEHRLAYTTRLSPIYRLRLLEARRQLEKLRDGEVKRPAHH
ncbi:MAG: hypothetical protein PHF72_01465 [Gammaproteobacteria bacterium]|nr:hypothetical protein [Gammaproteobacteria bacterium]